MTFAECVDHVIKGFFMTNDSFSEDQSLHFWKGDFYYEDGALLNDKFLESLYEQDWSKEHWHVKKAPYEYDKDKLEKMHIESKGYMLQNGSYEDCFIMDIKPLVDSAILQILKNTINQFEFDMSMILFDPLSGEVLTVDQVNEDNRRTYKADENAIQLINGILDLLQKIEVKKADYLKLLDVNKGVDAEVEQSAVTGISTLDFVTDNLNLMLDKLKSLE